MTDAQRHRGPDARGVDVRERVGVGHRRLSIVDLSGGAQPMSTDDGKVTLVYNGELYNVAELTRDLVAAGHVFHTRSDTEALLRAWEAWGVDCLLRLRGMFAFAVVDERRGILALARDPFGIKPLVYRADDRALTFASELTALRLGLDDEPDIRLASVDAFLKLQFIPAPQTIYQGVHKLPPAHVATTPLDRLELRVLRYWRARFRPASPRDAREVLDELDAAIDESVRAHLASDVPVGAFLSGGVDSTLVVRSMARAGVAVDAFTMGFGVERYNEVKWARQAAARFGATLHEGLVDEDMLDALPLMVQQCGEPFGDSSLLPTWFLSRFAASRVKVALSGDGGDELFGGYHTYGSFLPTARRAPRDLAEMRAGVGRLLHAGRTLLGEARPSRLSRWEAIISQIDDRRRALLWRPALIDTAWVPGHVYGDHALAFEHLDDLSFAQSIDIETYLASDILAKVDVASMAHSLEVRPPLLDVKVAEVAFALPLAMKRSPDGNGKVALKELLARQMPRDFAYRKKQGFSLPVREWFMPGGAARRNLRERLEDGAPLAAYFSLPALRALLDRHGSAHDESTLLWLLLVLSLWLEGRPARRQVTDGAQHVVMPIDALVHRTMLLHGAADAIVAVPSAILATSREALSSSPGVVEVISSSVGPQRAASMLIVIGPPESVSLSCLAVAARRGIRCIAFVAADGTAVVRRTAEWLGAASLRSTRRTLLHGVLGRGTRRERIARGMAFSVAERRCASVLRRGLSGASAAAAAPPGDLLPNRVVMAINTLAPGGAQRQLANTACALSRSGRWDVVILCLGGEYTNADHYEAALADAGVQLRSLPWVTSLAGTGVEPAVASLSAQLGRAGGALARSIVPLTKALRVLRPSVVHAWLDEPNVVTGLAASLVGVPRIVVSGRNMAPTAFDFHAPYMRPGYRALLGRPGAVLLNNSRAGARSYAQWLGIDERQIRVLYNGLDVPSPPTRGDIDRWRAREGIRPGARVVGTIARFFEEKQPLAWVAAAERMARAQEDIDFVVVGWGPLADAVRTAADVPELRGRFHLVAVTKAPELPTAAMDVFLLSSSVEGLPNVLLEAQLLGVPVVTTDAGGAAETVVVGETGDVVPIGNVEAMATSVLRILNTDGLAKRMGAAARQHAQSRFGVERMIEETEAVYEGA